jgi:hypothetical protein
MARFGIHPQDGCVAVPGRRQVSPASIGGIEQNNFANTSRAHTLRHLFLLLLVSSPQHEA